MPDVDNVVPFPRGPGTHRRSRGGAVIEAYVDTDALDRVCPNCKAAAGDFCVFPDGSQRHIACVARTRGSA